jgi:hydroxypyruvate isomerase
MPRFSANLSMLFTELPFEERFAAAAKAGFKTVEYMFPYEYPAEKLAGFLKDNGLTQNLFNLPAGNWNSGERGVAVLADREAEFKEGVTRALSYAKALRVGMLNCLVGKADPKDTSVRPRLVERLRYAADQLAGQNITLVMEPVNFFDMPGFYLNYTAQALEIIAEVGRPNLKIQYDVYHAQRMEGELIETLRKNLDRIGHVQIADNPGRNQPGGGEIHYKNLLNSLDSMGYKGYVGLEYKPAPDTLSSLQWITAHGFSL